MQWRWSYYDQSPSGRLLGVEPDYLPCVQMSCFIQVWTPYPNGGLWGGFPPHYSCRGVQGVRSWCSIPPWQGFGGSTPERTFFYKKCLVKYCNFIVNLDRSLCHRYDGRSYVNIRVLALEGNPLLYMRELYYDCVLFLETRLWESEEEVTLDLL